MTTLALAFLAGILSILSPCVLPLLPIILGAAISEHKLGPLALACGLALSFTTIGLFVALIGFSIGLDTGFFKNIAAVIMILIGLLLIISQLQMRLAVAGGPLTNWVEQRFSGFATQGLRGQFSVGLLMGAVWSPCVGPTLGAASILAAQGKDIAQVALTMLVFGFGAGLPLLLLGFFSRETLMRIRNRLIFAGKKAKMIMGGLFCLIGVFILTGFDKKIETVLVNISPEWLTRLTTNF
jgi:cytochrome c-type biogenesis protein